MPLYPPSSRIRIVIFGIKGRLRNVSQLPAAVVSAARLEYFTISPSPLQLAASWKSHNYLASLLATLINHIAAARLPALRPAYLFSVFVLFLPARRYASADTS